MEAQHATHQHKITLLQERSAGNFARVYLAEARGVDGINRIVAIKIIKDRWLNNIDLLNRTYDEARLLARLHHRNILRVEGVAKLEDQPAIIMEFVDGLDLQQLIEKQGAIPPRAAFRIVKESAMALDAAYARKPYGIDQPLQVVHRDIKPSNIMVSIQGSVKVLDFGTARYQDETRLAQTGMMRFGSLKYMSPERRCGDRGEHTSDIYGLGLVLIEMLTGVILPILPLEQPDHDDFIERQAQNLLSMGLPNQQWDEAMRQTIVRMCAYKNVNRLTADQVVNLMRDFEEQATGTSLDKFASHSVANLNKKLYSHGDAGALTGKTLSLNLSSQGDFLDQDPPSSLIQPDETPPMPQDPPKKRTPMLLVGILSAVLGAVLIAILLIGALLAGWFYMKAQPPALASFPVSLDATHEQIQWIKLNDTDGTNLLKAAPLATDQVVEGEYELAVKLMARSKRTTRITVAGPIVLSCGPEETVEDAILCTANNGEIFRLLPE